MAVKKTDKQFKFENDWAYIQNGIDLLNRRITLDDNVEAGAIGWICRAIEVMAEESTEKPIDIVVNCFGGEVYSGLALYDTIEAYKSVVPIRTIAKGAIMSMGVIIYLAADERTASPRASFMVHSVSGGAIGKTYEVEVDTKEIKRLNSMLCDILTDRTKRTRKYWEKEMKYEDKYYDVEKAVKLGIVNS